MKTRHIFQFLLTGTLLTTSSVLMSGCSDRGDYKEITADPQVVEPIESSAINEDTVPESLDKSNDQNSGDQSQVAGADGQSSETETAVAKATETASDSDVISSDSEEESKATEQVAQVDSEVPQTQPETQSARTPEEEKQYAMMRARLGFNNPGTPLDLTRELKLLIPHKELPLDEKTGAIRLTFDDIDLLKVLNVEKPPVDAIDHMPDWLTELDGKQVILRGWMYPTFKSDGIQKFLFVRDNGVCCFGPNAKIYDKIGVTLKPGKQTGYIQGRPFDVLGTFVLDPWILDEDLDLLYHLRDAVVIDK